MAILSYKLHIKDTNDGNKVYDCNCYTTTEEATPVSVNGTTINGSYWELKNNNTVCYIGLIPKSDAHTTYNTPLVIKKNSVEYYVQTQVANSYSVTINATTNQKITFKAGGVTTEVTSSAKTIYVASGTSYECYVTANTGYTKGTLSGASASGYVTSNMTIGASAATINSYIMTVTVPTGATITVGDTEFTQSGTVSLDYGAKVAISCASTNTAQYSVTGLTVNGTAFTSGNTYTMPASAVTTTCTSTVRKYTVTLEQAAGTTLTVTANSVAVTSGSSYNYGTVLTYSVADSDSTDAYENPTVSAGGI